MSIMDKLKKNSKIKETSTLSTSKFFTEKDMVSTDVPMVNVALSGSIDGGISPGLTVLAGPSKHFKTSFALLMAGAYLNAKPDAVMLFYDSEFGSPQSYFEQFGIDTDRVLHTPIANVEELKFDMVNQLEQLDREDDVIIVIDSIGNLASKKELEDALDIKVFYPDLKYCGDNAAMIAYLGSLRGSSKNKFVESCVRARWPLSELS